MGLGIDRRSRKTLQKLPSLGACAATAAKCERVRLALHPFRRRSSERVARQTKGVRPVPAGLRADLAGGLQVDYAAALKVDNEAREGAAFLNSNLRSCPLEPCRGRCLPDIAGATLQERFRDYESLARHLRRFGLPAHRPIGWRGQFSTRLNPVNDNDCRTPHRKARHVPPRQDRPRKRLQVRPTRRIRTHRQDLQPARRPQNRRRSERGRARQAHGARRGGEGGSPARAGGVPAGAGGFRRSGHQGPAGRREGRPADHDRTDQRRAPSRDRYPRSLRSHLPPAGVRRLAADRKETRGARCAASHGDGAHRQSLPQARHHPAAGIRSRRVDTGAENMPDDGPAGRRNDQAHEEPRDPCNVEAAA